MWNPDLILTTSVLLLLVLILRRPAARYFGPKAAYLLWLAPGIRLLLPTLPALQILSAESDPAAVASQISGQMTPQILEENFSLLVNMADGESAAQVSIGTIWPWIWAGGFAACLLVMALRQWRFAASLNRHDDLAIAPIVTRRAEALNVPAPKVLTGSDAQPMTLGLLRPVLVLPADFSARFSTEEQNCIIDHELLHIRRKDMWAKAAALLFCAANWFNPLAWYTLTCFEADQEAACDVDVLDQEGRARKPYAELLVKVADPQSYRTLLALEAGGSLQNRLIQISRKSLSQTRQKSGTIFAAMTSLALILGSAQYAQAKTDRSQQPELEFGFVRGIDDLKIVNFISSDGPMSPEEEIAWLAELDMKCPKFPETSFKFPRTIFTTKVNPAYENLEDYKGYSSLSCVTGPSMTDPQSYLNAIARAKESLPQAVRNEMPLANAAYQYLEYLEGYPEFLPLPITGKITDPQASIVDKKPARSLRTRMTVISMTDIPEGGVFIPTANGPKALEVFGTPGSEPVTLKDCGEKEEMEITWKVLKKPDGDFEVHQEFCLRSELYADTEKLKSFLLNDVEPLTYNPSMTPEYRTIILRDLKTKAESL